VCIAKAGSLKIKLLLSTVQEWFKRGAGRGRRCKKSTLNDLVHLTPLRILLLLINPPQIYNCTAIWVWDNRGKERGEKIC